MYRGTAVRDYVVAQNRKSLGCHPSDVSCSRAPDVCDLMRCLATGVEVILTLSIFQIVVFTTVAF